MEKKQFDVTALGELLIDFTENGNSSQGNPLMEANPGGAPCNVLAMLERLGKKTAFIGKVGKDMFGTQLKTAVEEVGIDTRNLIMDENCHTTLAFVHTYPDGDRDFSFYRDPGADMMLTKEEVQKDLIEASRIFHFGTLSSTHEGVREATRHAIDLAKEAGCIITFEFSCKTTVLLYHISFCCREDSWRRCPNHCQILYNDLTADPKSACQFSRCHRGIRIVEDLKDFSTSFRGVHKIPSSHTA